LEHLRQQELFQEIKEKNEIVSVLSEYISFKKTGRSLLGLCPFHSEKTPSFNVNQEKQYYYCFGCGAGGDVFNFIMKVDNLEFIDAARKLADRAGIVWPETTYSESDRFKNELYRINKLAASYFNYCLVKTDQGKQARDYLEKRGIPADIWQKFLLGFAPSGWHNFTEVLRKKNVSLEQAASLGLIGFGENGYYDRFRDRVIFPIFDSQGNVVGFGGRVIAQGEPKYLNSPETPLFHKGHFWYGLQLAKDSIRKKNQAIIMEGYMDVVQAHQSGFTQAVASLGTALTKEQAKIIKRYTNEVVLGYDADTAGQNATIRGMEILQDAGLKVKILRLPQNEDPDSFIKKFGVASFVEAVEKALGLIEFKIEQAIAKYDLNTHDGKNSVIQELLPELGAIENNITREFYIRQLVREIGVSENAILAELTLWLKTNRKKSPLLDKDLKNSYTKVTTEKTSLSLGITKFEEISPLQRAIFDAEKELLQSALQEYDKFERIKEKLKMEDFHFEIWRELFQQLQQIGPDLELSGVLAELTGSSREIASSIIAEQHFKSGHGDLPGIINHLQMLQLKQNIQALTDQISTERDQNGRNLSEDELKRKMTEFMELSRKFQKEYPSFSAEL
jgi:DNA primase